MLIRLEKNILWIVLILISIIRIIFIFSNDIDNSLSKYKGKVEIFGIVSNEPDQREGNIKIILDIKKISSDYINAKVLVNLALFEDIQYGDEVKVIGVIKRPENFDGLEGRTFDYIHYLAKDNIFYLINKPKIEIISHNNGNRLIKFLIKSKNSFIFNFKKVLNEPEASLAGGILLGEKQSLGKKLTEDFRRSGLVHIIVLSGFNITIIAKMIMLLLSPLPKRWRLILGGCGMILFGIMVGGGATVWRSVIMAMVALLAQGAGKDYSVIRALFLAAFIMIIANPMIILYDPSFQLSFLATFGLTILGGSVSEKIKFIPEKFGMRELVVSTLSTQIFVLPYILYQMGQVSILGIFANILVLPFMPITMLFVFLTGLSGYFSYVISLIFGAFAQILLSYEIVIVQFFSKIKITAISIPNFSIWYMFLAYFIYLSVYIFLLWRKKRREVLLNKIPV